MKLVPVTLKNKLSTFYNLSNLPNLHNKNIKLRGSISCCWGCPYEGKVDYEIIDNIIQRYIDLGVNMIDICDTIGIATSETTEILLSKILNKYPTELFSLHLHDTNGLAIESVIKGVNMGITTLQGSLAGLGGCPFSSKRVGNINTLKILKYLHYSGYYTGINIEKCEQIEKWLQTIFKKDIQKDI